jgi:hypothetical protein
MERKDDNMRTAWTRFRLFSQGSAKKRSEKYKICCSLGIKNKQVQYMCTLNDKAYIYGRARRFELFGE